MGRLSLMLVFLVLTLSFSVQGQENNVHQIRGGGSVVMEMSTAVWCDICAEHEEWIPDMVDSNGDRIIRVNLHSAINDPLGNEASNYRKGWLGQSDADSTPSYSFDGLRESTPSSSSGELQRSLLDAEADRIQHEVLEVSISFESSIVSVEAVVNEPLQINSTSMTLMLLENEASISPEDATNGKLSSNYVLKNIISVNENELIVYPQDWGAATIDSNTSIFSNFTFSWPNGLDYNSTTIVVIHEKSVTTPENGARTTFSALSWTLDQSVENESSSLWVPLILTGIIIAIIRFYSNEQ
ncbi:MAG: hypothetical protein ACJZ49_07435 [Candidatus Thalassarchaeaceae archaeon]|nr:MAG: hypothetical protein CMA04_000365 [Euryarchaeota archaeon]RPG76679.1 MAG: hypothetical protein CBC45_000050 [Euryarchaeota archaeon TMED85]